MDILIKRIVKMLMVGLLVGAIPISVMATGYHDDDDDGGGSSPPKGEWRSLGLDNHATSNAGPMNPKINLENIKKYGLKKKWRYDNMDDLQDVVYPFFADALFVPAIANVKIDGEMKKVAYFPDYAGRLHAVDTKDGSRIFRIDMAMAYSDISDLDNKERILFSRGTPAVGTIGKGHYKRTVLVMGSSESLFQSGFLPECEGDLQLICRPTDGAVVISVDASDGSLLWRTNVDPHPSGKN